MQLSIRDLTNLLDVDESTVADWIRQRGLPARRVGRHYRVNRSELLEWATANRVRVSLLLFDHLDAATDEVPSLHDALEAGGIHTLTGATDKDEALAALVRILPLPDGVDRDGILALLRARNGASSTAIGDGIAIPHVRNPMLLHVNRPIVTLAFLDKQVPFGHDGRPVHVLFTVISPTNRMHLQLLSRLSFALLDPGFRDKALTHAPPAAILAEARRVDAGMCVSDVDTQRVRG